MFAVFASPYPFVKFVSSKHIPFYLGTLAPNTPLIHTLFKYSKWNMYLKLIFLVKYDGEKLSRKNIYEIPPCAKPFSEIIFYFIERRFLSQNCKFSNKNDLLCAWMDFNNFFCDVCKTVSTYNKWDFKLQISSINFEYVNEVWISGVLGVTDSKTFTYWFMYLFIHVKTFRLNKTDYLVVFLTIFRGFTLIFSPTL